MGCTCAKPLQNEEIINTFNVGYEEDKTHEKIKNPIEAETVLNINNDNDNNDIINNNQYLENLKYNPIKNSEKIEQELNSNIQVQPELNEVKDNNNNNYNNNNPPSPYKQIITDKITKEEFESFLNEYTPLDLDDNINIELRPPILLDKDIIYYGEWDLKNNIRHGRGIQVWPNGEKYKGYWKQDHSSGKGKLFHINGDIYDGDWELDQPNGIGSYSKPNGEKYTGSWKNGKQEGKGEEIWPNGSKYVGEYKEGKKSGFGVLNFNDGNSYEGNFQENYMHGKGIYKFSDNTVYEGDWVMNKIEGKGVIIWPNGRKYEGDFKDSKKDGYGTLIDVDGKKYRGEWKDDLRHGEGEKFFPKENIWKKGIWENGKRIKWIN